MFDRYTQKAVRVVYFARMEAGAAGDDHLGPEHLMLGLIRASESLWRKIAGPECDSLTLQLKSALSLPGQAKTPIPDSLDIPVDDHAGIALRNAETEADRNLRHQVDIDDVLLGLLNSGSDHPMFEVLKQNGVTYETVRGKVLEGSEGGPAA
jgi:ATP-dependent Clp protease ATP-binding subunit ClpC